MSVASGSAPIWTSWEYRLHELLPILVPLAPLAAALFLAQRALTEQPRGSAAAVASGAMLVAFGLAIFGLLLVVAVGPWALRGWTWLAVGGVEVRFALVMDHLTAVMLVLVSGVSLIVHLYSRRYMQDEAGYRRFYALLSATTAVTLAMVMAGDLIQLFLLWQLMGVLLYLLIFVALGYSTVGQMGYMMMEAGLGAFALAIFHLAAHGIFKAALFLSAGGVVHATRRNPNMEPKPRTGPHPRLPLWIGVGATIAVPLLILIGMHEMLGISLPEHQGAIVLLFFGWVTASQAALSVYRAGARSSLNATLLMLATLFVVVFGYMWGGHAFESFLYPAGVGAGVGGAAVATIDWTLFYIAIVLATGLILLGWLAAFRRAEGADRRARTERWYDLAYVWVHGGLFVEGLYRSLIVRPAVALAGLVDRYL